MERRLCFESVKRGRNKTGQRYAESLPKRFGRNRIVFINITRRSLYLSKGRWAHDSKFIKSLWLQPDV